MRSGEAIAAALAVVVVLCLPGLRTVAHRQRRAAWAVLGSNRLLSAKCVHKRVYHVVGAQVALT